ncbi:MAG TPA: FAA hydrolase family protein [Actinobacteria bacterium]|nr:FAA hydrolase family protein [Actinomycetota bacterium]
MFPTKVVAVGRNYEDHAKELENPIPEIPVVFWKPSTSVIGPGAPIIYPAQTKDLQHEGELVVVIGKVAKNVAADDAAGSILGYTIGNDVTARDLQKSDTQWTRGKGFDTFCPIGPAIETEFDPLQGQQIEVKVNGDLRQSGSMSDMIFGVAELVEFITAFTTLLPGDIIMTGTPAGVGPMEPGDEVEVSIEQLGTLNNPVVSP